MTHSDFHLRRLDPTRPRDARQRFIMHPVPCPEKLRPEAHRHFCAALQHRGIYATHHPWFLSLAHAEADIDHTIDVAPDATREMKEELARIEAKT